MKGISGESPILVTDTKSMSDFFVLMILGEVEGVVTEDGSTELVLLNIIHLTSRFPMIGRSLKDRLKV